MQYQSTIRWKSDTQPFTAKTYTRSHDIHLPGGLTIAASSAPEFMGDAKRANPEELFISALSSCLMLTFLYLAAMKNLTIEAYEDEAIGQLAKNSEGKMAMTEVTLRPKLTFAAGVNADESVIAELFKKAHDQCFISCSVKTTVKIEPRH